MEDKTWELLMKSIDEIKADIVFIKKENQKQTNMINSLKVTTATITTSVSTFVTLFVAYIKNKIS